MIQWEIDRKIKCVCAYVWVSVCLLNVSECVHIVAKKIHSSELNTMTTTLEFNRSFSRVTGAARCDDPNVTS